MAREKGKETINKRKGWAGGGLGTIPEIKTTDPKIVAVVGGSIKRELQNACSKADVVFVNTTDQIASLLNCATSRVEAVIFELAGVEQSLSELQTIVLTCLESKAKSVLLSSNESISQRMTALGCNSVVRKFEDLCAIFPHILQLPKEEKEKIAPRASAPIGVAAQAG